MANKNEGIPVPEPENKDNDDIMESLPIGSQRKISPETQAVIDKHKKEFYEKHGMTEQLREMEERQKGDAEVKEAKKPTEVSEATNLQELYEVLDSKNGIVGSRGKIYGAEQLKELIGKAKMETVQQYIDAGRNGEFFVDKKWLEKSLKTNPVILSLTRTEGLRGQVVDLLMNEVENAEREGKSKRPEEERGGKKVEDSKPQENPQEEIDALKQGLEKHFSGEAVDKGISGATSFEELYSAINTAGGVEGVSPEELKSIIEKTRASVEAIKKHGGKVRTMNQGVFDRITRTEGLRSKVKELLENEEK